MEKKSIMDLMAEITEQANNLQQLSDEIITCNKIWVPSVGLVNLWEVKK